MTEPKRGSWWHRHQSGIVGVLVGAVVALALLCGLLVHAVLNQTDKLGDSIGANCVVLSVLLENRADRDTTVKLFAPIREQNPEQFDKLVERAEKGDVRLLAVAPDLSCKISAKTLKALRN